MTGRVRGCRLQPQTLWEILGRQAQRIDQVNSVILLPPCPMDTQGPQQQQQQPPQCGPVLINPGFGGFGLGFGGGGGSEDRGGSDQYRRGTPNRRP